MRRLFSIITLLGVLAALAAAAPSTATADGQAGLTCGGSVYSFTLYFQNFSGGIWGTEPTYNCGDSKTFLWEIQSTTDQGFHWTDYSMHYVKHAGPNCNNGCRSTYNDSADPCISDNQIDGYRVHFWWSDGDASWPSNGGRIGDWDMCVNGQPYVIIPQGQSG